MTYIPEAQIEARAVELWRQHSLAPGFDVERLLDDIGLDLVWEDVDDTEGGVVLGQLVPGMKRVVLNERHINRLEAKEGRLRRYTVAHEIGHSVLHATDLGGLSLFDGERICCRDGSSDSIERQAEMFAASLLIPKDPLLFALPKDPWKGWPAVYRLAERFLVNITPMTIRLERLGWMHRDEQNVPVSGPASASGQSSLFDEPPPRH